MGEQVHAFSGPIEAEPRVGNLRPRYNIAPTTDVHIIVAGGRGRELPELD